MEAVASPRHSGRVGVPSPTVAADGGGTPSLPILATASIIKLGRIVRRFAWAALAGALPVCADWQETLRSPDGSVEVSVCAKGRRLSWRVARKGVTLFDDSEIGLAFKGQKPFGAFKVANKSERAFDTSWETRLYKKRVVRDHGRELKLELAEADAPGRRFDVYVRAYDGAAALRYGIPAQPGFERFVVTREKTAFRFAGDPLGWFTLYPQHKDSQEQAFFHRSILTLPDHDALIGFPAIVETAGQFLALCEADLTDWAGLFLKRTGAWRVPSGMTQLEAEPSPRLDGEGLVVSSAPRVSPWRVAILGDTPAELTEHNDVILNLNPPPEGGDAAFAWVKPGASAWDWWAWPKGGGKKMTREAKCAEIDFAAEMGWPYYTIDAGWQSGESQDHAQDLTRAKPELELDAVLAHAKEKGVGVFLWAYWSVLESNGVERVFANMSARGVKGFKIDFMDRQDQEMVNWYEKVIRLAAKYKLLVNFHGAFHPTGMNRTWPNQITREAVAGNECHRYSWRLTPELTAALPFTRFLVGPADYTPGGFSNILPRQFTPVNRWKKGTDGTTPEIGTRGHALALCVAYDSPLMTLCDVPANYRGQPGLEALRNLPAAWDETRCLGGEIGSWYAVARKAPDGRRYLAAIAAGARRLALPLSFLGQGRWRMTLYADDPKANASDARALRVSRREVLGTETLGLDLAPIGGAVAVFELLDGKAAGGFDVSATPLVRVDAANAAQFTNVAWRAAAWRNERVHAPFVIRGVARAEGFTARVEPETERDAKAFSSVQVRWVRETLASANYRYPWVWVDVPEHKIGDILDPSQPFALTDRAFRALWVTVKTPPDAEPGRYRAHLVVKDAAGAEVRRALELEILPMALPDRRKMYLDIWQTPWTIARYYNVKPFSPEHYAKMEPVFRELAAAGQKAITATITDYPWNVRKNIDSARTMVRYVKRRDGSFVADFSTLDEYVAFAKRCGIGPQIHCYAIVKFQKHRDYWYHDEATGEEKHMDCDPGSPEYEAYWGPLLAQLEAHAKEKGWIGDIYAALDELRPPEVTLTAKLVKKYAPSLKFQMAGDVNPADFGDTQIDNYSQALRFDYVSRDFLAEAARRRARGLITTYYVCCVPERPNSFLTSPLVEQRWLGLFAAAKGLDGFLKSTSHRWMMDRDPLVDASCEPGWAPGECFLIYPGPLLSLRWEMMVDGFENFDKLAILRESGKMTPSLRNALRWIDYQRLLEGKTSDLERIVRNVEREIDAASRQER